MSIVSVLIILGAVGVTMGIGVFIGYQWCQMVEQGKQFRDEPQ